MRRFNNTAPKVLLGFGVLVAVFSFSFFAQAQSLDLPSQFAGLSSQDVKVTAENIVRIVFGLLGVLAVLLILYGGFVWMTSGGNPEKINQAKRIITSAVIGLLLIVMSYAIASFIVRNLNGDGGSGTGGPGPGPGPGPIAIGGGVIESHYPGVNAVNIPRNSNIVITFKEQINTADIFDSSGVVNGANLKIEDLVTGTVFSATGSSPDGYTFIIDPDNLLGSANGDARHRVTLSNAIRKADNSIALPLGYSWNFTVSSVSDVTSPEVVSVIPVAGSTVDRNTLVQINFSEPVSPVTSAGSTASGFVNITLRTTGIVSGVYTIGNQYHTVEFQTDQLCGTNSCGGDVYCLDGASLFTGDATAGVTDMAGNPLIPYNWTFNTNDNIDLVPPVISSQVPRHGASGLSVVAPLEVTFSKLMSVATLNTTNITVTNSGYWIDSTNIGGRTKVTINHPAFAPQNAYNVAVNSAVKDINQNCYSPCQCISTDGSCGCAVSQSGCTGFNCTSAE